MELGFSGEVVEFYHRYRHGYPAAVLADLLLNRRGSRRAARGEPDPVNQPDIEPVTET